MEAAWLSHAASNWTTSSAECARWCLSYWCENKEFHSQSQPPSLKNQFLNLRSEHSKLTLLKQEAAGLRAQTEQELKILKARIAFSQQKSELTLKNEQLTEDLYVLESQWAKILRRKRREERRRKPRFLQAKDPDAGLDELTKALNKAKRKNAVLNGRREKKYEAVVFSLVREKKFMRFFADEGENYTGRGDF